MLRFIVCLLGFSWADVEEPLVNQKARAWGDAAEWRYSVRGWSGFRGDE